MISVKILDNSGKERTSLAGEDINLKVSGFSEGDKIIIEAGGCEYIAVQLDASLKESIVSIPGGVYSFNVPTGQRLLPYCPGAFEGECEIKVRIPSDEEIYAYRNLALNTADQRGAEGIYPHASANFVTRDEFVFEERNSIDGVVENVGHGKYPFQSWAGGAREDIDYKLNFGRKIKCDKIAFYLRAEFHNDHDTYWKTLNVEFSDGTKIPMNFEKTADVQVLQLAEPVTTEFIRLIDFKQATEQLSWAALTQIEVYGNILIDEGTKQ